LKNGFMATRPSGGEKTHQETAHEKDSGVHRTCLPRFRSCYCFFVATSAGWMGAYKCCAKAGEGKASTVNSLISLEKTRRGHTTHSSIGLPKFVTTQPWIVTSRQPDSSIFRIRRVPYSQFLIPRLHQPASQQARLTSQRTGPTHSSPHTARPSQRTSFIDRSFEGRALFLEKVHHPLSTGVIFQNHFSQKRQTAFFSLQRQDLCHRFFLHSVRLSKDLPWGQSKGQTCNTLRSKGNG